MPIPLKAPTWEDTEPTDSAIPSWDDTQPLSAPRQEEISRAPTFTEEIGKALTGGAPFTQGLRAYNVIKNRIAPEPTAPYGATRLTEDDRPFTKEIQIDQTDKTPLGIARGVGSATVNLGNRVMSGLTSGIPSLPLFMLPGAPAAYAIDTAAKIPQQIEGVQHTRATQGGAEAAKEAVDTTISDAMAFLPLLGREHVAQSTEHGSSKGLQPKFEETEPVEPIVESKPLENNDLTHGLPSGKAVTQRFQKPTGPEAENVQMAAELGLPPEIEKPIRDNFPPVEETPEPEAPPPPAAATTGIANRHLEADAEAGRIGQIDPGEGISWQESVERGRNLLNGGADPHMIARRIERTGRLSADDMAVLRAERERLAVETNAAMDALERNPSDLVANAAHDQARAAETDFIRNAVQPAKTQWHKLGMATQGEAPIDVSTFAGLRKAALDEKGRDVTPVEEKHLRRAAKQTQEANAKEAQSLQRLGKEVERQLPKKKARTIEEVKAEAAKIMDELMPCNL